MPVIIILAIIALIATLIVFNIISETKESAGLRSAEFYLNAVEYAIANSTLNNEGINEGTYNVLDNGNICLEYNQDKTECTNELIVKVDGDIPDSGIITITGGAVSAIKLVYEEDTIVQNSKGNLIYQTQ